MGHRGRRKWSTIFWTSQPRQTFLHPKAMIMMKKKLILKIFHKKNQKVLITIDKMADVFLNSANFQQQTFFFTLVPPSSYNTNLETLIKVSKIF